LLENSNRLLYYGFMIQQAEMASMHCTTCKIECRSFGRHRNGLRRFRCGSCKRTYTEAHAPRTDTNPLGVLRMPMEKAVLALQLLVEGSSVRTTERITGLHRDTILRLLVHAGEKCQALMGRMIVNVPVKQVQCDEIWGYVGKKEKNKTVEEKNNDALGDAYCFVAIERHTKLILNFALGRRNQLTTDVFIEGLRHATAPKPFQLTTDGFTPYLSAIDNTLSDRVDYAVLVKQYAEKPEPEKRYSPAECIGCKKQAVIGNPDPAMISTSHIERSNLTMRTQVKRLARLTLSFSKKWDNLWYAIALHFAYYNFCRIHKTLRVTPAMESNLTDHVWTVAELLG
jgi:IS1 family transposase/transposase-like protein